MKKLILSLMAVIGISAFSASAQDRMYRPGEFTDYAFEGIFFSPAQQTRIDSIYQAVKVYAQTPASKRPEKTTGVVWRKGMPDYLQSDKYNKYESPSAGIPLWFFQKVEEVLTPAQYEKFITNLTRMPSDVKFTTMHG